MAATISTRPSNWNSAPLAFSAAQFVATGATSWTVRLDATELADFSESARTIPLVSTTGGLVNVNPAAITIQTTGFPGTGTWSFIPNANALSLVYSPDLYMTWTSGIAWNGKDSAPNADPDADGLVNLLEYSLGGNPLSPGSSVLPVLSMTGNRLHLTFNRVADPALLYEVLASGEPNPLAGAWTVVWSSTGASNIAGSVTVDDALVFPTPDRRFIRLRVSR